MYSEGSALKDFTHWIGNVNWKVKQAIKLTLPVVPEAKNKNEANLHENGRWGTKVNTDLFNCFWKQLRYRFPKKKISQPILFSVTNHWKNGGWYAGHKNKFLGLFSGVGMNKMKNTRRIYAGGFANLVPSPKNQKKRQLLLDDFLVLYKEGTNPQRSQRKKEIYRLPTVYSHLSANYNTWGIKA